MKAVVGTFNKEKALSVIVKTLTLCLNAVLIVQDEALEEDNAVREGIKELQSVGPDNLEAGELEEMVQMLYQIQGKLSYILSLFETLHRWGTARRLCILWWIVYLDHRGRAASGDWTMQSADVPWH